MQARNIIVILVLGVAIAAGLALALRNTGGPAAPLAATVLPVGNELPDFALLDHDGKPVDRTVFEGQWDVVFFGFTEVCRRRLSRTAGDDDGAGTGETPARGAGP